MKTTTAQRAYTTHRTDLDNSIWCQEEAAQKADQDGDHKEAHRRRIAAEQLKRKHKRGPVEPVPAGLIRELGPRDPISNMLKARELEARHGQTALLLRQYHMGVANQASGNLIFVQGGRATGMEALLDRLRGGQRAHQAALGSMPSEEFKKPLHGLVCGRITLLQAGRMLGGQTDRSKQRIKVALRAYLEAAEPYFGASA